MSNLNDFDSLVYLAFKLIESETGKPNSEISNWKNNAQVLCVKIFRHISSMKQLYEGSNFYYGATESFSYVDISSIAALTRAAYESYFAFHYIFLHSDQTIVDYRYKTWRLAGLKGRAKLLANTTESKAKIVAEGLSIIELMDEIKKHPHHQTLSEKRQKHILEGNWEPYGGWSNMSVDVGMHQKFFTDIYRGLSTHVHSGFISVLQIRDASTSALQRELCLGLLDNGALLLAHLIHAYVEFFPDSKAIFDSSPLSEIAGNWYIRTEDVEHIYGTLQDK